MFTDVCVCVTIQRKHGFVASAVLDARTGLRAGLPQVLVLPRGRDHAPHERRHPPVIIGQTHTGQHPPTHGQHETQQLQCQRHVHADFTTID